MMKQSFNLPAPCRAHTAVIAMISCTMLHGCQQYQPRPVDVAAHRAEFLARTPDLASTARREDSAVAAPRQSGAAGLSLDEAERVALYFNATLRRARRDAGIALAASENGGLWTDPTISLEFTRILQSVSNPNELFGGFNLSIPISGRLEIEKARLGLAHAAALADVARLEWSTRMELRRAWAQWSALRLQAAAVAEFSEFVSSVVSVVEAMAKSGDVARIDARLFRLEKFSASADAQRLQAQCKQAELSIMRLLGLPPSFTAHLEPSILAPLAPGSIAALDPATDAVQQRILDGSPSLLVAKAEYEVAEHRLKEEIARQLPDLQVSPNYGTQNAERQFLLGLAIPLPIFNGNRRAIAEAFASREVARADIELELETAMAAAAFRHSELRAASVRSEIFESDLLPLAELQYREAREVARLGEVNTLALLESLKRRKEAQIGLIEAARDETVAAIGIEEVVGEPVGPVAGETK
jgi:cobalt-zinc-cadmium efflux system outer membrane protein